MVADQLGAGGDACAGSPPHAMLTPCMSPQRPIMRAWFMKQVFIAGSDYVFWRKEGKADNDIVQACLAH